MEKLAIFDIDYTITKKETLIQFFMYVIAQDKRNIKYIPRALLGGFLYLIRAYDEKMVKESFLKFLEDKTENEVKDLAKGFYNDKLSKLLYKDGLDMIKKLKSEGFKIYLISASPEFYLFELYSIKEVDKIIGTKFKFENNKFIRKMDGLNCKGQEKVRRLTECLKKENIEVDFKNSYMFSDSISDQPLLDKVGNPYLINYKKQSKFQSLYWE